MIYFPVHVYAISFSVEELRQLGSILIPLLLGVAVLVVAFSADWSADRTRLLCCSLKKLLRRSRESRSSTQEEKKESVLPQAKIKSADFATSATSNVNPCYHNRHNWNHYYYGVIYLYLASTILISQQWCYFRTIQLIFHGLMSNDFFFLYTGAFIHAELADEKYSLAYFWKL